jgi:transcriptional regulator with XRE-family HTH domain
MSTDSATQTSNLRVQPPRRTDLGAAIRNTYAARFTQGEIARQLGVAQNTVSRWSTGDVEPSLGDIFRIEQLCGFPRGHILRAAGYVSELASPEELISSDHRLDSARRDLLFSAYMTALRQSNPGSGVPVS